VPSVESGRITAIDPSELRARKGSVRVLDLEMALIDEGEGPSSFLLLHGNPTSSFLVAGGDRGAAAAGTMHRPGPEFNPGAELPSPHLK